jgi:hypothetical protein
MRSRSPKVRREPRPSIACPGWLDALSSSSVPLTKIEQPPIPASKALSTVHFTGVGKSDGAASRLIPRIHAGVPSAPGPEKSTQWITLPSQHT